MPIYEYACPHCHTTFEEWLKNDDDAAEHPCPDCGQAAKRLISHTTFVLKGGGWYVTEYGGHKEKPEASPEGEAKAPESGAAAASDVDKGKASAPAESGSVTGTPASSAAASSASSGADAGSAAAPATPAKSSQPIAGAA